MSISIVNAEVRETFVKRSKIISAIRRYMEVQGYYGGRDALPAYHHGRR